MPRKISQKNALNKEEDDNCAVLLDKSVSKNKGIRGVQLDPVEASLVIKYNPDEVSEREIGQITGSIEPILTRRLETCTVRLQKRGGRACESCALILENRVGELEGVRQVNASYFGGVLRVRYDAEQISKTELLKHVKQLGIPVPPSDTLAADQIDQNLPKRLWESIQNGLNSNRVAAIFTAITFLTMCLGLIAENLAFPPIISKISFTVAYATGGTFGFKAGIESLRARTIDVDLLMILAAIGAAVVGAPFEGAMLLFLFSLSNVLQSYAMDRTRNAIRSLMKLRPKEALTLHGNKRILLPIQDIRIGDIIYVRPGERVPMDGEVIEGESSIDQSPLTGESIPVSKAAGDEVLAGTINQYGTLEVEVTRLAKDSTLAKLIKLVEEAHSEKAKTQRFIDKAEQYYAMGVIIFTTLAITVPILFLNEAFSPAFYRGMSLMVAASPCALVISTPASILSAIGNGAKKGVLFKGGIYLEQAAAIKVVAFDKTGTLTTGMPRVTDIKVFSTQNDVWCGNENDLLALAASVEAKSEHPLAQAIVAEAQSLNLDLAEATSFQSIPGRGVRARVGEMWVHIGSTRYFEDSSQIELDASKTEVENLHSNGKTSILIGIEHERGKAKTIIGVIGIADVLRDNIPQLIRKLKSQGVQQVVMLTGDNHLVAKNIAEEAGLDEFYAELLPEEKLDIIKDIERQYGPVAMVGDGVNDAPALATATIGIAMGAAGTDVALETADVVLMSDDLRNIPYAIALSRKTRKVLVQNLFFASAVILVLIVSVLSYQIALPLSVIGHEGSTVVVSLNGLRLLGFRMEKTL